MKAFISSGSGSYDDVSQHFISATAASASRVRLIIARPYANESGRRSHLLQAAVRVPRPCVHLIRQSILCSDSICSSTRATMSTGEHPGRSESFIPTKGHPVPMEMPFSAFAYTTYMPTSTAGTRGVVIPTPIRKAPGETQVGPR